jgi:hypothetical protein
MGKAPDGEGKIKMSITLKRETTEYTLHPEGGPYSAVLSEIRSHDGVETAFGVKNRLQLTFQTTKKLRDYEHDINDDRPCTVTAFVNATLNEKGRLMGFITQQIPPMELGGMLSDGKDLDIEALLVGTQWLLTIEHNESGGTTYANILASMKAPPEQQIGIWNDDIGL